MDSQRYRIVAIGDKSPNMLSEFCNELLGCNCEIQSISSLRLGHSFVVVVMVESYIDSLEIERCLLAVVNDYKLKLIIDTCTRKTFKFQKSDVFMRVKGINTTGIKEAVISKLTAGGLDIHGLESDIYREDEKNIFVINVKGHASTENFDNLTRVAAELQEENMEVAISNEWKLLI
ncbi:hypothetical protein [uncultured Cocleimonas sp.]|uniref:hypothetical protein n=1 Tax=uncultured Cocleimonas sp. TaxID=1051587 RepID=UPI002633F4E3|nr:hypothetical protein [uncultured Cocleimonas sp.]